MKSAENTPGFGGTDSPSNDVLVIGSGVSGIYALYSMRQLGLKVKALEAGTGVGGTWYWNRYPGARFDSESYSYNYSFSKELLDEWVWKEHFSAQPDTEKYLNYVVDKFDLRKDIQLGTRVKSLHYDERARLWHITSETGEEFQSRFVISCVGPLSFPTLPRIPGIHDFKGKYTHTARWPKEGMGWEGKRVAVIGTGATGIQTIQEASKVVGHLTVFQRRPNWCAPLHNSPITPEQMAKIKSNYPEMFKLCKSTFANFLHTPDDRNTFDVSDEEREAHYEKLYNAPGFGIWLGNFKDALSDRKANDALCDFVARKIRQRVKDPAVADKLIPKDHGFGSRRVPLETKYYECYNQPNVELVDIKESPIERITEKGIKTKHKEYEFDIIIYATGFNAPTGSYDCMDIRGLNGETLLSKWSEGPQTYLGLSVEGFPNLFMVCGPQTHLGNMPRSIEYCVDFLTGIIGYAFEKGYSQVQATKEAEKEWVEHVTELSKGLLMSDVDSWMTGVNYNVDGKDKKSVIRYCGGAPAYRSRVDAVSAAGYRGFDIN